MYYYYSYLDQIYFNEAIHNVITLHHKQYAKHNALKFYSKHIMSSVLYISVNPYLLSYISINGLVHKLG